MNYAVLIPIAVWGAACLAVALIAGRALFRARPLPPTRHVLRVRIVP